MKKFVSLVLMFCIILMRTSVYASNKYFYEGKSFYTSPIPGELPSYIPKGTTPLDMIVYTASSNFDKDAFVNSEYGKLSASYLYATRAGFNGEMDPQLLEYWKERGVIKVQYGGETKETTDNYYIYTPANMKNDGSQKYPLIIFNHGSGSNAFACEGTGFIQMIEKEQFIVAVAEDVSAKNIYDRVYETAITKYPVDKSRVYVAGTSMGAMAALDFAAQYPELVTAVAPFDISPKITVTDEQKAKLKNLGMPMVFTTGLSDKYNAYPMNTNQMNGIDGYNTLLDVAGFEKYALTAEESAALVNDSMNIIERYTGLRFPYTKIQHYVNNRLYMNDFVNDQGICMLKIIVVENKHLC
jgi:predicted esterase